MNDPNTNAEMFNFFYFIFAGYLYKTVYNRNGITSTNSNSVPGFIIWLFTGKVLFVVECHFFY